MSAQDCGKERYIPVTNQSVLSSRTALSPFISWIAFINVYDGPLPLPFALASDNRLLVWKVRHKRVDKLLKGSFGNMIGRERAGIGGSRDRGIRRANCGAAKRTLYLCVPTTAFVVKFGEIPTCNADGAERMSTGRCKRCRTSPMENAEYMCISQNVNAKHT